MFVKLLALLISNVLVSFSVLLCCRSLTSICRLKGENDSKWRFGVPASALERTMCDRAHCARAQQTRLSAPACERAKPRSSVSTIEHKTSDRAHSTLAYCPSPSLTCLRRGSSGAVMCDRAHRGLHSSAQRVIERTHVTGSTFIFL